MTQIHKTHVPLFCAIVEGNDENFIPNLINLGKTMTPEEVFDIIRKYFLFGIQRSSFIGEIKEYTVHTPLGTKNFAIY